MHFIPISGTSGFSGLSEYENKYKNTFLFIENLFFSRVKYIKITIPIFWNWTIGFYGSPKYENKYQKIKNIENKYQ